MNMDQLHYSQSQSFCKNALIVASCVEWKNWQLGSEYIKHVLMKNTQLKMQKIIYEVPKSRFFTTLFPKPIILNAWTSYQLPITFHPLQKKVYRDILKCHTQTGDFEVVLLASLPLIEVAFPKSLVMPRCTLYGTIDKSFQLKNVGEMTIPIKWSFSDPFEIKPEECMMDPGETCSFNIIFRPKFAKFYEGTMICQFGSEEIKYKKMRIIAEGKYPHLLVSIPGPEEQKGADGLTTNVCFENVEVGFTKQKVITVKNFSLVEIPFKIEHPSRNPHMRIDAVFDVVIKDGLIPPLSCVELPILFTPSIVDAIYIDYFHVLPTGGMTKNVIKCVGNSVAADRKQNMDQRTHRKQRKKENYHTMPSKANPSSDMNLLCYLLNQSTEKKNLSLATPLIRNIKHRIRGRVQLPENCDKNNEDGKTNQRGSLYNTDKDDEEFYNLLLKSCE